MTATATDTLTVSALTARDAEDVARRQWEPFGFRVLRVVEVRRVGTEGLVVPRWKVTADVEVVRR